jgi:hypothetical protein
METSLAKDDKSTAKVLTKPSKKAAIVATVADIHPALRLAACRVTKRYDLKISVPASDDAFKALWDALYLLITKLQTVDKTLIVYPWEESDLSDKVLTNANIPKTVVELKQFFSRAIPRSKCGLLYISAYLGHNKEMSAIMEEIGYWLKEQSSGLWMRQLQTDRTHLVGWALYSTNQMNELLLGAAIEVKTGVAVSIRWRMISTGQRGQIPVNEQVKALHLEVAWKDYNKSVSRLQSVKALHLEVAWKDYNKSVSRLQSVYKSNNSNDLPLGIKLCIIPEMNQLTNTTTRRKAERLRQAAFTMKIEGQTSREVSNLDYFDAALGQSLR